jgi:hypothetical protein
MMPFMTKIYTSILPDVKTIAPARLSSEVSRQIFWHPENATLGDRFFDLPAPTLTAQGILPRRSKRTPRRHK